MRSRVVYINRFLQINKKIVSMQNSHPVKLEIIKLQLADKSDDNFMCSISLMKGMQNFGEIKFQIDKDYTEYAFSDQKIIKFFYVPRLTTRRDAFFKIILTDLESKQQMGQIPISTHFLAETFQNNPIAVIEENKQFFQGVSLCYKIYQPLFQLNVQEKSIGFGAQKLDTKNSGFFTREQVQQMKTSRTAKSNKNIQSLKKETQAQKITITVPEDFLEPQSELKQSKETKKQQSKSKPKVPILNSLVKQPIIQPVIQEVEIKDVNPLAALINPPQKQAANLKVSMDLHSSQFVNRMLGLVRQTAYIQQKKKHSLQAKSASHHGQHKLSKKLKFVIFLLIFGLLMTIFDIYQDKQESKILKKSKKSKNQKKTKTIHH